MAMNISVATLSKFNAAFVGLAFFSYYLIYFGSPLWRFLSISFFNLCANRRISFLGGHVLVGFYLISSE
jgi:hypothetical protein